VIAVPPTRHLLRAKDLADARYREPLDVRTLARAAHLSPAHFSREFADALVENESEVRRLLTGIEGFRAYFLVRTADGAVSVSVYDDEGGAEESNRAAADWVRENLPHLSIGPPQISAGEVVISI